MISPDEANLGVKAIYVWAGLLVPTIAILYFFYPEVSPSPESGMALADDFRRMAEHTSSWTSFTSEASPLGSSSRRKRPPMPPVERTSRSFTTPRTPTGTLRSTGCWSKGKGQM
jgi:hypothetical protein